MKKIMIFTITMVFAFALGTAYAGMNIEGARYGGHAALFNGVTDFTGRSYEVVPDILSMDPADKDEVKGISAGGIRDERVPHLYNGVTDFTGKSYDTVPELF